MRGEGLMDTLVDPTFAHNIVDFTVAEVDDVTLL